MFDAPSTRAELKQAETFLNWLLSVWNEPYVSNRVILRRGPNSIRNKATAVFRALNRRFDPGKKLAVKRGIRSQWNPEANFAWMRID